MALSAQGHPEADFETEMGVEDVVLLPPAAAAARSAWRPRLKLRARLDPDSPSGSTISCIAWRSTRMARALRPRDRVRALVNAEDLAALDHGADASALAMVPTAGSQHTVGPSST